MLPRSAGGGAFADGPCPVGFDFYAGLFAGSPVAVAAPRPVFGALDQAAFDRVSVDVLELFNELVIGKDVEVVVAFFPEVGTVAF